jgi:predicted RNA-binding Zn-ribbon protein involved in translation (DUF1610 family)
VGKRGKCPKCGNKVIVPDKSTTIVLKCGSCGLRINVPRSRAGKKGRCPNCKNPIAVPAEKSPVRKPEVNNPDDTSRLLGNDVGLTLLEVPEELKLADEQISEFPEVAADCERGQVFKEPLAEDGQAESDGRRKLPWIIDIFLYPSSKAGLTTLAIIVLIPLLIRIVLKLLGKFSSQVPFLLVLTLPISIVGFLVSILLYLYLYWFFYECIRDSSTGGVRAPETIANTPGFGEMFWQWLRTICCLLVFIAPVLIYYLYTERSDTVFWVLLVYAVIFFPMALLAVAMFDSISGLNPVLLIGSILSTFLPYCAMIAAFVTVGFLLVNNIPETDNSSVLKFVLRCVNVYLLIVVAHLLGRFYWRYQDKLNWEV